jgi:hypothetical protein
MGVPARDGIARHLGALQRARAIAHAFGTCRVEPDCAPAGTGSAVAILFATVRRRICNLSLSPLPYLTLSRTTDCELLGLATIPEEHGLFLVPRYGSRSPQEAPCVRFRQTCSTVRRLRPSRLYLFRSRPLDSRRRNLRIRLFELRANRFTPGFGLLQCGHDWAAYA